MGKTRTRWPGRSYSRVVPGASGRVLVVDDNKVIRQLIRVNLELEGLEVVTAADGAECLDVVHQVRPDLVTLDVVMALSPSTAREKSGGGEMSRLRRQYQATE